MPSSATNIGSSWSDPFHRSLRCRLKLESTSTYHQHLCLPVLQRSRDRMSALHIDHKKESGIDGATRLFNDTKAHPSSMIDPSLLISGHDDMYADDFALDVGTATSMEEDAITDGYGDHSGHYFPAMSPSEALALLDSFAVDFSALTSGQAASVGNAEAVAPSAPQSVPLAAQAVVHGPVQTSAQQKLPTAAYDLTPPCTPAPADTLDAVSFVLAASDVVTDAGPEAATNATAVSCELLRG